MPLNELKAPMELNYEEIVFFQSPVSVGYSAGAVSFKMKAFLFPFEGQFAMM